MEKRIPYVGDWKGQKGNHCEWVEVEEVQRCENLIMQHFLRLRRTFRHYAVSGSSKSISWTLYQFESFIKLCKIKVTTGCWWYT